MMKTSGQDAMNGHVVVMGLGVSGRAALRYLVSRGVQVSVSDAGDIQRWPQDDREFIERHRIEYECGGHTLEFLQRADRVLVSPGIMQDLDVLCRLREQGVAVLGELAFVAPLLDKPVVAITGTNGKTTVTALVGELLREAGKKVFVGGNIGTSLFEYLQEGLDVDVLVLELSSFQLEMAGPFKADVAVLLNITPDHLDRHGSMEAYANAKGNVFAGQGKDDTAVLCGDDPWCRNVLPGISAGHTLLFGRAAGCQARVAPHAVTLQWLGKSEHYDLRGSMLDTVTGGLNSAAAIAAVRSLGCPVDAIVKGLKRFQVAAHRMMQVGELAGVCYYDDSKATNTGAVISALENFAGHVILIAGGRGKGEDYSLLRESVQQKVRLLILLGESREEMAAALQGTTKIMMAPTMEEAVRLAASQAMPGDTVLLSPACASFDMFENYGHRGRVFAGSVEALKVAAGDCSHDQ